MRKIVHVVLLVILVFFFYPAKPHSRIQTWQKKVKSAVLPKKDYTKEINRKTEELAALERMHNEITRKLGVATANAPICPRTGKKSALVINSDPRPKIREDCQVLRQEILALQMKMRE